MAKGTRALTGAAKDAYLKRTLRAEPELAEPVRERLTERLRGEIASVTLKAAPATDVAEAGPDKERPAASHVPAPAAPAAPAPSLADAPSIFDPYHPNVIVVIRTRGREAVLAELAGIDDVDHLRLLAREQQLGIGGDLTSAVDIRMAIVAAAERRIANRRAAAS
jgi:hypothetical protein